MSCPVAGSPAYWAAFADFCRKEKALGGPDPHIAMTAWLVRDLPLPKKIAMGACYMAVYNVAMAEVLFNELVGLERQELAGWLEENFHRIIFRRERRAARSPAKLLSCLVGYGDSKIIRWALEGTAVPNYDYWWRYVKELPTVGRYIALKLMEYFHRIGIAPPAPDIRPVGGDWPRQTLRELWLRDGIHGNSPVVLAEVNRWAESTQERLRKDHDLLLSPYELETLLCEWRQMYKSRRFYPGRPLDSELSYYHRVRQLWPDSTSEIITARAALFPTAALGEQQGWEGRREELGGWLHRHGQVWSDLEQDYESIRNSA